MCATTVAAWPCRLRLTPESNLYVPMPVSLWGAGEETHMHINPHINFVLHATDDFITGAAAYSGMLHTKGSRRRVDDICVCLIG